jgi:predicted  nucleic acid-binding Zn ribbon protein
MPHESAATPPDPYWKLRHTPQTPDEEICHCDPCKQLMLRDSFGDSPLYCVACNGEVAPERIGFDARLAEDIASWRSVYRSLYLLWLDSGEYEAWAMERLRDPDGSVNVHGRRIVQRLNEYIRAYYWWFNDIGIEGYVPPEHCPACSGNLAACDDRDFKKCDRCSILI